uniref:Insulin-like domain-containing protein n=1 Tax=Acrobeloides nanus TaxID=290746 RepID=A0A914D7T7_9BILA
MLFFQNSKAIKLCGHRLTKALDKICATTTFSEEESNDDRLEAYFEGLKIAKTCCQYGCSDIQLNQLCLAFSYKQQEADDGSKQFINKPLKL